MPIPSGHPVIQGLKYFKPLIPLLAKLRDVGCARDKAGNRSLHYDQYCLLVLLFLFNPTSRSMRALQRASLLEGVQKKLGVKRTSLGSLSEAVEIFDPERLLAVIESLSAKVRPIRNVAAGHLRKTLIAVDGSVVKTLKSVLKASFMTDKNGQSHSGWRLHTHFDVDRNVPVSIEVTPGSNSGKNDEKDRLRAAIQADRCYVMDRWYSQFSLWNEIVAKGSDYVCRIRDNSNLETVVERRVVSEAATASGVIDDFTVDLGTRSKPDHVVRVILVKATPHKKTGGRKGGTAGPPSDGILRIATNNLDAPAEVIAGIYLHRWTIETFFRMFKHVLGCKHLLSTHRKGIEIQSYCAIIACLLISLWTNRKPSLRTYEMICWYMMGIATEKEFEEHIMKLPLQPA